MARTQENLTQNEHLRRISRDEINAAKGRAYQTPNWAFARGESSVMIAVDAAVAFACMSAYVLLRSQASARADVVVDG